MARRVFEFRRPTCLSPLKHGRGDIDNIQSHFLGCISISERVNFLREDNDLWVFLAERDGRRENLKEDKASKAKRWEVADSLRSVFRRVDILRKAIHEDEMFKHLVDNIIESSTDWKAAKQRPTEPCETTDGWPDVRDLLESICEKENPEDQNDDIDRQPDQIPQYSVEKDIKARILRFSRKRGHPGQRFAGVPEYTGAESIKGIFPDQEIPFNLIMEPEGQFFRLQNSGIALEFEYLRHYHIPCNNMSWVRDALANYYGLPKKNRKRGLKCKKLREAVRKDIMKLPVMQHSRWLGQVHGSQYDMVHTRHLRPFCDRFPTSIPDSTKPKQVVADQESTLSNIVLFMPYLHWETDRNRAKVGDMIERYTRRNNDKEIDKFRKHVDEIRTAWQGNDAGKLVRQLMSPEDRSKYFANAITKNLEDVLWQEVREEHWKKSKKEQKSSKVFTGSRIDQWRRFMPQSRKKYLAQYLLDAAALFEAMSCYQECKLFEKYLFADPPAHPRRSLDQSYMWRLNSTRRRDRDQVVYRYTRPRIPHRFQPRANNQGGLPPRLLGVMGNDCVGNIKGDHPFCWNGHGEAQKNGCFDCWEDSLLVSRCVMVDQLWMWVLDNDTILTCFPQRYGLGKEDASGVHKIIRDQLSPPNQVPIFSVWDLALVILEACFDSFFDRKITTDRRPQVLDMFSESISNVANQQAIAFRHLWQLSDGLANKLNSGVFRTERNVDRLILPLLDVTKEGRLQQEIRDIIDELDMMIHIVRGQKEVIESFIAHTKTIFEDEEAVRNEEREKFQREDEIRSRKEDEGWPQKEDEERFWNKDDNISQSKISSSNGRSIKIIDVSPSTSRSSDSGSEPDMDRSGGTNSDYAKPSFVDKVSKLKWKLKHRMAELQDLKQSAEDTAQNVKDLLDLKQQQAGVVQAYQAMVQGDETVKQGQAIMLFTVVTIIFMPLSFISAVFGMNAVEFELAKDSKTTSAHGVNKRFLDPIQNFYPVTFRRQLWIIFTAAIGLVPFIFFPGFSRRFRMLVWITLRYLKESIKAQWHIHVPDLGVPIIDNMVEMAEMRIREMQVRAQRARGEKMWRTSLESNKIHRPLNPSGYRLPRESHEITESSQMSAQNGGRRVMVHAASPMVTVVPWDPPAGETTPSELEEGRAVTTSEVG